MRSLFWTSSAVIVYVYAGYPLLLMAWARLAAARPSTLDSPGAHGTDDLSASIVIAARNEARRLPARIDNLLSSKYPADRLQIIVVSDGSTDGTAAALASFADRVELVAVPPAGKAAALNAGVARATNDILIFADARQRFSPGAVRALTARFADPRVGCVSGELVLGCEPGGQRHGIERRGDATPSSIGRRRGADRRRDARSTVADAIGIYWRYEKELRRLESIVGSMLGATGAIYALRRSLWRPLPDGTLLDDVLAPMRTVLAGRRIVFEPGAQAFDATARDSRAERNRKIRTLAGNVQILWLEPRLLVPFANPVWVQYVSHKVGRLVVPYALIGLMAANIALAADHPFYAATLAAQCAFYCLGGYGAWLELGASRVAFWEGASIDEEPAANA